MMRACGFILIVLMLFFSAINVSNASTDNDKNIWLELNQTSDKILQLVREEKLEEAKQIMNYFSDQFLSIKYNEANVSMSDLRVATTSFENAMEAVTSVSMRQEERLKLVMEFRLAIDALSTEHHPLWLNTRSTVMKSIADMKQAATEKEAQAFQHSTNAFLRNYQMIRPALMLDLEPAAFQRIESHVQYLKRYRNNIVDDAQKTGHLAVMENDFNEMYDRIQKDSADPSLLWVMLTIGGMIVISLSYAGWKKYKGEKKKLKMGEGND